MRVREGSTKWLIAAGAASPDEGELSSCPSHLTLLRGDGVEGSPALFDLGAPTVRAGDPAFLILGKGQDLRKLFLAGLAIEAVMGHDSLPLYASRF
jgi:hypothetical protein